MKGFIIAGTHSGTGKTTISLALMQCLKKRGLSVQPFKVGPDYIDPDYHTALCRRPSYNIDTWMMGVIGVRRTFEQAMQDADIGIVEGVMGLFDGKDGNTDEGSTAHIAKILKLPVILVVDARGMARSAGALVYGYETFDPAVKIAGIIFNKVGSMRHYNMLKNALKTKCKSKALGYIPRETEITLPQRHLGLVMANNSRNKRIDTRFKRLGELIEKFVDIDEILKLQESSIKSNELHVKKANTKLSTPNPKLPHTRIAVAVDKAFCFYYQENLDMLKQLGAELVFISPLKDKKLPENINGLILGGGYPELYAKKLTSNITLRDAIKTLSYKGLPIYAECGGLMYLGKGLRDFKGEQHEMVGVFPWVSRMLEKRKTLGYAEIKAIAGCPFLKKGEIIRGHEYHYSEIDKPSGKIKRVYQSTVHSSTSTAMEGYLYKNTLASYIHLHFASNPSFAAGFMEKCIVQ